MSKTYFQRVTKQMSTIFWINKPTSEQAEWALENGALGCTNNPSYTQKMRKFTYAYQEKISSR